MARDWAGLEAVIRSHADGDGMLDRRAAWQAAIEVLLMPAGGQQIGQGLMLWCAELGDRRVSVPEVVAEARAVVGE